jgi:hypothetical protein
MKERSTKGQNELSNHEVVTLAVYLLGEHSRRADFLGADREPGMG